MFRYFGFALIIDSELELPDLPAGEGEPDVFIRMGSVPRVRQDATTDEEFAFNRLAGAFHIRYGREIVVDPLPGVDPHALRVVLLGRMMAFLLRQRGWLPLHASGIAIDGCGVLFLGPSGAGKSTTAAAFHSRGHLVITDDVGAVRVVEGRCMVRPAWSRLRLLEDSREVFKGLNLQTEFQLDKYAFDLAGGTLLKLFPVKKIYAIEYGRELRVDVVPPLAAAAMLSTHSFVKHRHMTREALDGHLRSCASVAALTPVYRLFRRESVDVLPSLVDMVEKEMASDV